MTAIAPPPLSLTILRQGERLFVDLAEVGTLIPRGETRVEDAFLREVAAELRLLATPGFGHGEAREGRNPYAPSAMLASSVGHSAWSVWAVSVLPPLPRVRSGPPACGRAWRSLPAPGRAALSRALGVGL